MTNSIALVKVAKLNKLYIYPENYLKAAGELLFLLFIVCWVLTYMFRPDMFDENPMIDRIGYNNLCIGFDAPPATYAGLIMFFPCIYLMMRYCVTDMARTAMVRDRLTTTQVWFSYCTDMVMIVSICAFGLVFVISPMDNIWVHTICFHQYIICRFLCVLANMAEHPNPPKESWYFVYVYGIVSVCTVATCEICYIAYDNADKTINPKPDPFIPWWITCFFDQAWFLCLAATSRFLPNAEEIRYHGISVADHKVRDPFDDEETPLTRIANTHSDHPLATKKFPLTLPHELRPIDHGPLQGPTHAVCSVIVAVVAMPFVLLVLLLFLLILPFLYVSWLCNSSTIWNIKYDLTRAHLTANKQASGCSPGVMHIEEVIDPEEEAFFECMLKKYSMDGAMGCPVANQVSSGPSHFDQVSGHTLQLLPGRLEIKSDLIAELPKELRQGLFGQEGEYEAVLKHNLAELPGGVPLKRIEIKALAGDNSDQEMDFIFSSAGPEMFAKNGYAFDLAMDLGKKALNRNALSLTNMQEVMATKKRVEASVESCEQYTMVPVYELPVFGMLPFKLGAGAVKYAMFPHASNRRAFEAPPPPEPDDEHGKMKYAVALAQAETDAAAQGKGTITYDFKVQIATETSTPGPVAAVEDGACCWDEHHSPWCTVGSFTVFPESSKDQEARWGPRALWPVKLQFSPDNVPASWAPHHTPLGHCNRLRSFFYKHRSYQRRCHRLHNGGDPKWEEQAPGEAWRQQQVEWVRKGLGSQPVEGKD